MTLGLLFSNKSLKAKDKTQELCNYLLNEIISTNELIDFAISAKDSDKATCIEALEFASKIKIEIIDKKCFQFVTDSLTNKAPRVKWEAAKVIGNSAQLFRNQLDEAITNLLKNASHEGTVVRWSAAYALGEILELKTKHNKDLIPRVKSVCNSEIKNSIKKIYEKALKKCVD